MNKKIASVIGAAGLAASLFFMGCGGSGGGAIGGVALTALSGVLEDGPISNATVQLATMKKGALAGAVTDENGAYTLNVPTSELENMGDDDLPYLYAESSASSEVTTSTTDTRVALEAGQVSFRSMLTPASLRAIASTTKTVISTADTAEQGDLKDLVNGLTITHFSNAKALVVESNLLARGVLQDGEQLTPKIFNKKKVIKDSLISAIADEVVSVEEAIADTSTAESQLWIGLAIATQEMVEKGKIDLFVGASGTKAKTNAPALLLEAATKALAVTDSIDMNAAKTKLMSDIQNRFDKVIDQTLVGKIGNVNVNTIKQAFTEDKSKARYRLTKTMLRYSNKDVNRNSSLIAFGSELGFTLSQTAIGSTTKELSYTNFDGSNANVVFNVDGPKVILKEIHGESIDADISKLMVGVNDFSAGVSIALSAPVTSVADSVVLSNGEFFKLSVSKDTNDWTLWLGSTKKVGQTIPLGLVGAEGLDQTGTTHLLTNMGNLNGMGAYPFTTSYIDQVFPCAGLAFDAACEVELAYSVPSFSYVTAEEECGHPTIVATGCYTPHSFVHFDVDKDNIFKGTRKNVNEDYSVLRLSNGNSKHDVVLAYTKEGNWVKKSNGEMVHSNSAADGDYTKFDNAEDILTVDQRRVAIPAEELSRNYNIGNVGSSERVTHIDLDWTGQFYKFDDLILGRLLNFSDEHVAWGPLFIHPKSEAVPLYVKINGVKYHPTKSVATPTLPTSGTLNVFPNFSSKAEYESWWAENTSIDGLLSTTATESTTYDLSNGDYDVFIERNFVTGNKYMLHGNYDPELTTPQYFKLTGFDKDSAVFADHFGGVLTYITSVFESTPLDSYDNRLRIKTAAGDRHFHWSTTDGINGISNGLGQSGYSYLEYANYPARITEIKGSPKPVTP